MGVPPKGARSARLQAVLEGIELVFSDTRAGAKKTLADLRSIRGHCDELIGMLEAELKRKGRRVE